jgi:rhamnulokinase
VSVKKLFAVDLGASGGKCFVGAFEDRSFEMREVHRFEHKGVSFFDRAADGSEEERVFWDDIAIYENIVEGLHAYRRESGDHLDALAVDTWGADGQFLTSDGDLLGRIYCYRDHRLDDMADEVKALIDPERIYSITGIHFQPFNISNQLLWFARNRSDLLQHAACFLPVPSVFTYYLSGERVVDSSWASVTQVMDAASQTWSEEILSALGIPVSVMPRIVPPGAVVGTLRPALAQRIGLNEAEVIAAASHDTASAFAAAPVSDPAKSLIISSGTWALVGKLVEKPITSIEAMSANLSNEGGIGNTRLLKNCMGGWLVQELRRAWRLRDGDAMSWKEMDALTEAAPSFTAFINPDDPGFYNPENMEEAMMDFCRKTGQTEPPDRGTMMRMIYESLALQYRAINEEICGVTGTTTDVVNIVGGGSRNTLLNQCIADALRVPVVAGPEEGTAVGNLMVQALGMGVIASLPEAQPMIRGAFSIHDIQPRVDRDWDSAYETFKAICSRS